MSRRGAAARTATTVLRPRDIRRPADTDTRSARTEYARALTAARKAKETK